MVALRRGAKVRLVDPRSDVIPTGSTHIHFLRESIASNQPDVNGSDPLHKEISELLAKESLFEKAIRVRAETVTGESLWDLLDMSAILTLLDTELGPSFNQVVEEVPRLECLKRIAQEDKSYYLILSQRKGAARERQDTDDQAAAFELLELPTFTL